MVFSEEILEAHNSYRKNHGAPAMRWNSQLEANAQSWAQSLAKKGYLQHANQSREGENIACLKGAELTGGKATEMWYAEIKDYDFKNPGFSSKTGHFTQVVWANSIELGVGRAVASNGMEFVVARYYPPGNMLRSFPDNVNVPGSSSVDNPNLNSNRNNNNANPVSTNRNSNRNNNNGNPATTNGSRTTTTDNNQSDTRTNNNYNNNSNNNNNNNNDRGTSSRQSDKNFTFNLLRSHNAYRKRHGAGILKWDSELAKTAQEAAEDAAHSNTLRSVDMNNVGQNMAAMTGGELTGERVTAMWYDEEQKYDYNKPGFSSSTGSFTQLVWQGTEKIGVGRAFGPQGQTFIIALYSPPGNIRGRYETNVGRPSGPIPVIKPTGQKNEKTCCAIL